MVSSLICYSATILCCFSFPANSVSEQSKWKVPKLPGRMKMIDMQYDKESMSSNRRILADDDRFKDSHQPILNEKDGNIGEGVDYTYAPSSTDVPTFTTGECSPENGIYGNGASKKIDISYSYEIEVNSDSLGKMENEIVPAVEDAIIQSLLAQFLPVCSQTRFLTEKSRMIKPSRKRTLREFRGRKLNVEGISAKPNDKYKEDKTCGLEIKNGIRCAFVDGGMSFYLSTGTSDNDAETTRGGALAFIKNNMNDKVYDKSHDNIISILFIENGMSGEGDGTDSITLNTAQGVDETKEVGKGYSTIVIASCATLALAALLIAKGRQTHDAEKEEGYDEDEENISDDNVSDQAHY